MDTSMYPVAALLVLCLGAAVWTRRGPKGSKPPGPPSLPVIGNLLDIPRKAEALTYSAMADKYGDIVYMSVGNTNIFVVSSLQVLNELFNKRGVNYSDRPYSTMISKLMDLDWIFAFRSYGKIWRDQRKLFHSRFQESVVSEYRPTLVKAAHDVASKIIASPDQSLKHLHMHVANFLMGVTYGIEVTPKNAYLVRCADDVIMAWSKVAVPGAYLVDVFPFLQYIPEWLIPGGGFRKEARECKEKAITARGTPFKKVVDEMANGNDHPSFVSRVVAEAGSETDLNSIESAAGTAYFAGTEAIVISLYTFLLAMVAFPKVCARAQQEIDEVVGKGRLPSFEDHESLPYVDALVKEVLRWNPPAPLAIPHVTVQDDSYEGYDIPAGSIVIGSLWKIVHNPEVFASPMEFNPARFLEGIEGCDPATALEHFEVVYGCGRRVCPGRWVAFEQLFITIATILSVFDLQPGLDANGRPVDIKPGFTYGLASHPLPFKFRINPRGNYVHDLLATAE